MMFLSSTRREEKFFGILATPSRKLHLNFEGLAKVFFSPFFPSTLNVGKNFSEGNKLTD